jgi:hypothetical protein
MARAIAASVSIAVGGALFACGAASTPAPPVAEAPSPSSTLATPPASAPAPSSSAPPSPSEAASASAVAPASAPLPPMPTGGRVLIGEIAGTPGFDPKATLEASKPLLLDCYNQARRENPALHGKLKLRIHINEAGVVLLVDAEVRPEAGRHPEGDQGEPPAPGSSAADPTLVSCIDGALRAVRFSRPAGSAVVVAPLVFHP